MGKIKPLWKVEGNYECQKSNFCSTSF